MHDLHCECREMLKHCNTERARAERKMKKLAAALLLADERFAIEIIEGCNAEGGLMIDLPAHLDGSAPNFTPEVTPHPDGSEGGSDV